MCVLHAVSFSAPALNQGHLRLFLTSSISPHAHCACCVPRSLPSPHTPHFCHSHFQQTERAQAQPGCSFPCILLQLSLRLIAGIQWNLFWIGGIRRTQRSFLWPDLKADSHLVRVSWQVPFVLFSGSHVAFPQFCHPLGEHQAGILLFLLFPGPATSVLGIIRTLAGNYLGPSLALNQGANHISS